ncbi:hypothetical protein B0H11DRAFT_2234485 [Mycena galericulata]|nr:hypothetical protein B0H11DRAFT_2234485 [Mycena galericulata]
MSFAVLDDIALAAPRRYQPRARRPCRPTFVNCNPVVLICHVSRLHYASSDPPAPINKVFLYGPLPTPFSGQLIPTSGSKHRGRVEGERR